MVTTLSRSQGVSVLRAAGFSPAAAAVGTGIMYAESRRVVEATHHNSNGSTDYGLMQINSIHGYDSKRLVTDPLYNADCAYRIYKDAGGTWGPWSTYHNGSYVAGQTAETAGTVSLPTNIPDPGTIGGRGMSVPTGGGSDFLRKQWEGVKAYLGTDKALGNGVVAVAKDPQGAIGGAVNNAVGSALGVNGFLGKISDRQLWNKIGLGALAGFIVLIGIVIWIEPDAVKTISKLPIVPV